MTIIAGLPRTNRAWGPLLLRAILLGSVVFPVSAHASEPPAHDILVTARKQMEAEHVVALPIRTLTAETLADHAIEDWHDLADHVPGLTVSPSPRGTLMPAIRGVGFNNPSLSATSPIAVYVDEGSYPFPAMNSGPMLDLERVEVLKGPQGTLFGRNATGGLINYVTRKPGDRNEGHIRLHSGAWQRYGLEAAATLPVSDGLSVRAAGLIDRSDEGWQQRRSGPERLGRDRKAAVRLSMRWRYSGEGTLNASFNWWQDKSDTQAPQSVGLYPQGLIAQGLAPADWPAAAAAIGLPASFFDQGIDPRTAGQADWVTTQLPWGGSTFTPAPLALRKDNALHTALLRADHALGGNLTLTALAHYAHLDRREVNDASGWTIENSLLRSDGRAESFSQEVRLAGAFAGLPWLIGASHTRDTVRDIDDAWVGTSSALQVLRAQASGIAVLGGADAATQAEIFYGARAAGNRMSQTAHSTALFGEADFPITARLTLTSGLRFSRDRTRFSGCSADLGDGNLAALLNPFYNAIGIPAAIGPGDCVTFLGDIATPLLSGGTVPFPAQGRVRDRLREDSLTGRLVLRWRPAEGQMLYLSVARGSKAGSFPNIEANLASQYAPAGRERLDAIEGGAKLRWGDRLSLSASLFHYDYRDKQVFGAVEDILFTTLSRLVNVPRSHAYGADIQARAALPGGWHADLAAAWLKTRIDDYVGYDEFGAPRDFKGGVFSYAPALDLTATLGRTIPIAPGLDGDLAVTWHHASTSWADMLRDPLFRIDGHDRIDLSLALRLARPDMTVRLNVENLTNSYRWTNAYLVNDSLTRYAARPRHWTLSLVRIW